MVIFPRGLVITSPVIIVPRGTGLVPASPRVLSLGVGKFGALAPFVSPPSLVLISRITIALSWGRLIIPSISFGGVSAHLLLRSASKGCVSTFYLSLALFSPLGGLCLSAGRGDAH